MSCRSITQGRSTLCKENVGGIKRVYFLNQFTLNKDNMTISDKLVTATGTNAQIYKYELDGLGSSFEETNEVSRDNGTSFFTQTATLVLHSMDAPANNNLLTLSKTSPQAIIEDYNGNFILIGLENGLDVAITSATGAGLGDMNGYTLTLTGLEPENFFFVEPAIIGDSTNTTIQV